MNISHKEKTLADLIKLRSDIHLNPAWQRGAVWSESKQSLLIDSILRGYDIPMIYFRVLASGLPFKYEVVDGQQRLRALWNYIDNNYPLSVSSPKIGASIISGKFYSQLSQTLKEKIDNFPVMLAYVKDARDPEISKLFSRMQMGVRLTPAELRNAVQTGLRHAIDSTARLHPFFIESRINASRFKRQDYLSHAISICYHKASQDLKAHQLMDDYINITDSVEYAPLISDADDILTFMMKINSLSSKRIKQKWIFVDLFYLLYQNRGNLKSLNKNDFSKTYTDFDLNRLRYNAEPEILLTSKKPTPDAKRLYKYIQAFTISGGDRKNLQIRNEVLKQQFKNVLGA